ncbi:coiled-coil domain-containing protein 122 [Pseudorasbora parva]|uniref:coiled-coil domain-containing protein 122 n=1 Tax=Pseudorasbora parva TaxID=51549 RepID=UPI00351E13BD
MMDNHREQDFPLNDALQEVLQQGATRAQELRDAQHQLHALQASLAEVDQSCVCVCSAVSLKERLLSAAQCEMEQVYSTSICLDSQIQNVLLENLKLRAGLEEQQEKSRSQLREFSSYRGEMEDYRTALRALESRAHVHQELREREQQLQELRGAMEELKTDLEKPEGSAVRQTQKEIDVLKANINECRQTVRKRRAEVEEEERAQTQLRREIEIQQRRCEAVLKRLRCQLMKAQAGHWQLRMDITHLEQQVQELRAQLEERR